MIDTLEYTVFESVQDINRAAWQALEVPSFPFLDYDFHAAMASCCGERTGWHSRFLVANRGDQVAGILPFYEKTNSYGEYIFDWDWAHAYHQHGIDYYPKWVVATPFTPATGPKCLAEDEGVMGAMSAQLVERYQQSQARSLHALFLNENELGAWENVGLSSRHSIQFHWRNRDFESFGDFLESLKGKRRRQIVREREHLDEQVTITCYHDSNWEDGLADIFYRFYRDTVEKKHAIAYLTPEFFNQIFATMRDRVVLFVARVDGDPVGASLSFVKGEGMYGRYWGCTEEYRNLHFELCFYRTIEFAIDHNLQKLEAGAQGPHKIKRGFDGTTILSAHTLKDIRFENAIKRYIDHEKEEVGRAVTEALSHSAYKDL